METTVYEDQAKALIADMKQLIETKGIADGNALAEAGLSRERADKIFSGQELPSLSEFLALCQISGISFQLPTVETPNTPM
ncbi:transcriptional regulator [Dyadobacter sp. CY347]|uniref:transcriptional regulator n=1 Tax=Dyadobacter sp. CY347 TaxID=2909336 RepID=UPI001F3206BB|nr:transcriptional regulator [Dyadobacter sp. CY347]MCF2488895.1 transcriptional regulator [Dyadobacter sp. CY347]